MKRATSMGAIALSFLAGCVSAPRPASDVEIETAKSNLGACLIRAIAQLDDGRSDAGSVGMAVESMCSVQFSQFAEANGRGLNPVAYNLYLQKLRPDQLEFATRMVLEARANRAHRNSN
jgi:hypothetical protein